MQDLKAQTDFTALCSELSINADLIPQDLDHQKAYQILHVPLKKLGQKLKIEHPWQLLFFCTNIISSDILIQYQNDKDNWENTIAHYAAWSGNIEALIWIKTNAQELLSSKNRYQSNIAHYAAWSSNIKALDWIKINIPEALFETNYFQTNTAHYAAWSGNIEALNWLKINTPQLLPMINSWDSNIAYFAAWSGNILCLEQALLLLKNPWNFIYYISIETITTTVSQYLEMNYTVTKTSSDFFDNSVFEFLQRNIAVKKSKLKFMSIIQAKPGSVAHLPVEAQIIILKHLLPENVDVIRVYQSLLPCSRAVFVLQEEIRRLVHLDFSLKLHDPSKVGQRIAALSDLVGQLKNHPSELKTILDDWKTKYSSIFSTSMRYNPSAFWGSEKKSSKHVTQCISLVEKILGLENLSGKIEGSELSDSTCYASDSFELS